MRGRRVGLFGGSFDPVHRGHLHVARAAREARRLDKVLFVPAARPPHKPGVGLESGEHRLAMLELALAGEPACEALDLELGREGPSYTIDTVLALERQLEQLEQLFLLIGGDNLAGLRTWARVEELLERVEPLVIARGEELEAQLEGLAGALSARAIERLRGGLLDLPPVMLSATEVRAALQRGAALPAGSIAPAVAEYIAEHGLYRA